MEQIQFRSEKDLEECLMGISSKAKKSINILSPYLGQNAHRLLSENIKKLDVKLVVDFGDSSVKLGATSPNEVEVFKKIGEVKSNKNLHSKLYIFDNKRVLLTSANLTQNGFKSNLEVGIETNKTLSECQKYFDRIWRQSEEISYDRIADAKKMYKPTYGAKPSSKRTSRKWKSEPKKERFWKFGVTDGNMSGFETVWSECIEGSHISIGWYWSGNLLNYKEKGNALKNAIIKKAKANRVKKNRVQARQLATFRDSIQIGDYVVAYNKLKIVGIGRIKKNYNWRERLYFKHTRKVQWVKSVCIGEVKKGGAVKIVGKRESIYKILAKQPTIVEIKERDKEKILELL